MPTSLLIPLAGAVIGYTRSRTKKGRIPGALLWGVGAMIAAPMVQRMTGVRLPERIG